MQRSELGSELAAGLAQASQSAALDLADGVGDADAQLGHVGRLLTLVHGTASLCTRVHGRKPSKIIWSAQRAAHCRSASVRTVQVNSGKRKTRRAKSGANAGRSATA